MCVLTVPSTCIDKNEKKNKNVPPDFSLPTESNQMEFSFVRSFLSLSFSITTYSVLHTFSVDISSSVQTKKNKTTDSCLLPLAIASQGS